MVGKMAQRDQSTGEEGFLSRWSQRKQALREGKPLVEPEPPAKPILSENFKTNQPLAGIDPARGATNSIVTEPPAKENEALPPAPTMSDVHELTPQSDFKPFKPDPLPPEMLRKMAVTRFLGFWDEEEKEAAEKKAREDAERESAQNVAQSEPVITEEKPATPEQITTETPVAAASAKANTHDHPDLQLQPDDAAGRQAPVRSAG
jgi:hypothetical protein